MSQICGLLKCTSALAQPPWLPSVWASWISRKCNLLQSVLWRLLFQQDANIFWWVTGHCSLQKSCQEVESDKADGLSIKTVFPYTQCCFQILCESSDPESSQIPNEGRISYHSGCGTVVLDSLLVVFLLIVPVLSFSHVFHCFSFPSHPSQDFCCASKYVPGVYCPLCGLRALTLLKSV